MKKGDLFPLAEWPTMEERKKFKIDIYQYDSTLRVMYTGEFREPKAGEWFLSGSIVEGYRTKNNLDYKYHIGKLVKIKKTEIIQIVEEE